jgi:hypothetical protein
MHLLVGRAAGRAVVIIHRAAVRASVVRRSQAPAVVVSELDDDIVSRLDGRSCGREAALAGEGPSGASADGVVDHREVHVVAHVGPPS